MSNLTVSRFEKYTTDIASFKTNYCVQKYFPEPKKSCPNRREDNNVAFGTVLCPFYAYHFHLYIQALIFHWKVQYSLQNIIREKNYQKATAESLIWAHAKIKLFIKKQLGQ